MCTCRPELDYMCPTHVRERGRGVISAMTYGRDGVNRIRYPKPNVLGLAAGR